ncbi:MAG: DNA repair exonuclease [Clostridia bacterium]|nr:DNA repair exonuclease [Clostridia bacterium]
MPNIIHAADFHIGAKFDFLPSERAAQAVKLQLKALQALVTYAAESAADVVLIAGDLFDTPDIRPQISSAVFALLAKCPCPIFLSPGNHDYYHAGSPYVTQPLPSNLHVFTSRTLEPYVLDDGETVIWGAAFQDNKASISLDAPLNPAKLNICLVHGELGGTGGYNSLSESAVISSRFDYIALGHNHRFSGVFRIGQTALSCPGCFSATASNETGIKGYLAGKLEKGNAALTFHASEATEFVEISVPMTGIHDDTSLGETLLPLLPTPPNRICLTVHLTGTRMYEPNLSALTRSLRHSFFHALVIDESAAMQDLYRYKNDDDLRGTVTRDFMSRMERCGNDERSYAKLTLALEYALAALDGRELD